MELKSKINRQNIITKKYIIVILLLSMCILLGFNVYMQVSAKALIDKCKNMDNIKNELTVIAKIKLLDSKENLDFNVITNANKTNYLNIKEPKLSINGNGFILNGKISISDVLDFSKSKEEKDVTYYFDKDENLISGTIDLDNSLNDDIINIISKNILKSNENLSIKDIKNTIECNSKSNVSFSQADKKVVDEIFNTKLIKQIKALNTSNIIDKELLKVKIDNNTYILNKSKIKDANKNDTVYKKDDVIYYLNDKVIYGISGKVKDIDYNGIKSLDDLKNSLGEPTNKINDISYWEIKNNNNILYITYTNDYIEIMYK